MAFQGKIVRLYSIMVRSSGVHEYYNCIQPIQTTVSYEPELILHESCITDVSELIHISWFIVYIHGTLYEATIFIHTEVPN